MTLTYTIEDLEAHEFVVDFEFHVELDGQFVFDGAWNILSVNDADGIGVEWFDMPKADQMVHRWLTNGGEDKIYAEVNKRINFV